MLLQVLLLLLVANANAGGTTGPEIVLFPAGAVPGERPGVSPSNNTEHDGSRVSDVSNPTLTPFLVKGATNAVVICPGGAYEFLSWDLEGTAVAAWLNSLNVSAFILKYRVPARPWLPFGAAPLMDAQRAMGLIRSNFSAYGLNASSKLGIIGFSAGSHLSAHLGTTAGNSPTKRAYPAVDAADKLSCRPDFVMLLYPWCVVGDNAVPHSSCNADSNNTMTLPVTSKAPSFFITQAEDDPVHCENALLLYLALKKAKAPPSELHIYSAGGHGFGLCQHGLDVCSWTKRAQQYLETMQVIAGDPRLDPDQPPGPNRRQLKHDDRARAPAKRTLMTWLLDTGAGAKPPQPDSPAVWAARIEVMNKHKMNITHISPCVFSFGKGGEFAFNPVQNKYVVPHLPAYQAMGLEIVPLIDAAGGIGGLAALIKKPQPFIDAAVAEAMKRNYSGYNFDNELRGSGKASSWKFLAPYSKPWMAFLDLFAGALHAKGKTLSVDIAGCCGWVDTLHPKGPAGHCAGAFSNNEFVATTCAQYAASKLDIVYGMSTYSGGLNGPVMKSPTDPAAPPRSDTVVTKTIANATQSAVGKEKYAIGFKGGWPHCVNGSVPSTCVFDATAKATIDFVKNTLGVVHSAHWVDEMSSDAAWEAAGYWLHGGD